MEIRIVVAQPVRRLLENLRHGLRARARLPLKLGQGSKLRLQDLGGAASNARKGSCGMATSHLITGLGSQTYLLF